MLARSLLRHLRRKPIANLDPFPPDPSSTDHTPSQPPPLSEHETIECPLSPSSPNRTQEHKNTWESLRSQFFSSNPTQETEHVINRAAPVVLPQQKERANHENETARDRGARGSGDTKGSVFSAESPSSPPSRVRAAVAMRDAFLRRVASEDLYDVVRRNPAGYFRHVPGLDPMSGSRREGLLRRLHELRGDVTKLSEEELRVAYRLGVVSLEDVVAELGEGEDSKLGENKEGGQMEKQRNREGVKDGVDSKESGIPWPYVSLIHEAKATLRGDPTLDMAPSLSKGKHVSSPREFTQEDLERINKWDENFRSREVVDTVLDRRLSLFKVDPEVNQTMRTMQNIKKETLEDADYQESISFVQAEGDQLWKSAVRKNARPRPWKSGAADHVYFFQDKGSRVPRHGLYNLPPVNSNPQYSAPDARRKFFRHTKITHARSLQRSGRSYRLPSASPGG